MHRVYLRKMCYSTSCFSTINKTSRQKYYNLSQAKICQILLNQVQWLTSSSTNFTSLSLVPRYPVAWNTSCYLLAPYAYFHKQNQFFFKVLVRIKLKLSCYWVERPLISPKNSMHRCHHMSLQIRKTVEHPSKASKRIVICWKVVPTATFRASTVVLATTSPSVS